MQQFLQPHEVRQFIKDIISEGQFFTLIFQKKDGTLRRMRAQTGVKKHLAGGVSTHSQHPEHLVLWDPDVQPAGGYRTIDDRKVVFIRSGYLHLGTEVKEHVFDAKGNERV